MIKGTLIILLIIVYSFGGIYMENNKMITEPAIWAFFGFIIGILIGCIISCNSWRSDDRKNSTNNT